MAPDVFLRLSKEVLAGSKYGYQAGATHSRVADAPMRSKKAVKALKIFLQPRWPTRQKCTNFGGY